MTSRATAHPPPRTWNTWDGSFEVVLGERDHSASVRRRHDRLLLQRPAQRFEVVTQPGGELELELLARSGHPPLDALHHQVGLACHEVAKSSTIARFQSLSRAQHMARCTCRYVRAGRPSDLAGALEHTGRAGPRRKHAQQQIERFANRPRMGVGPK